MTNIKVDICTAMLCPDTCSQKTAKEDIRCNRSPMTTDIKYFVDRFGFNTDAKWCVFGVNVKRPANSCLSV